MSARERNPERETQVGHSGIGGESSVDEWRIMARKADFTEQEWESLQKGVVGAGLLVSLSDRSFFDTFKEAGALGKHMAQAKQGNSSELVRELADIHGSGFGLTSSPDALQKETMTALQTAKATLESKAPDESEPYRQFVIEVAQSVADAAGGGETAEHSTIEQITSALR
jgi:tellurite resistance protein